MHAFTEEEFRAIEADSAKRFDGRTMMIELPDFDAQIVVAPHSRASYALHVDAETRDLQTAYHAAALARLLWPTFGEFETLRQGCAMLCRHISTELDLEAGMEPTPRIVRPLDPASPPDGLSGAEAKRLMTESKVKLWSVEKPGVGLSCVMATPVTNTWLAAKTMYDDALRKNEGIIAGMEPYIVGSVVWSRVPLVSEDGRGLLDLKPGLFWTLHLAYERMGGAGATVRRKSLRDGAAPAPGGPEPAVRGLVA
jgi:hypothetical protein